MNRVVMILLTLLFFSACSSAGFKHSGKELSADENLKQQSLVMQKLHLMQQANLELNALEIEGMSKHDIKRIKRAMERKIELLLEEAIYLIEVL